jgi:Flp pilus assembly protein TadG
MSRTRNFIKQTGGAAAVIIALVLFVLIGMASLAIDIGQLYTVRNQLQNVADAAALAGVGQLVQDQGGEAVRNSDLAHQAALQVAQSQSNLDGLPSVADESRNDLTIHFGVWDIYAGNPSTAWTDLGTSVASNSNANAVKITITRDAGTIFGPVSNLFGGIFGFSTSKVSAKAIAYLGYTSGVQTGAVPIPLALPPAILTASNGHSGWFARLFEPAEAVASTTKTYVFRDTGGGYVNTSVTSASPLDPNQAYLFTVGQNDPVPGTIWNILEKIYNPSKTGTILYVADLKLNQRVYARSEFKYGNSYISPIFQRLQKAYNYKTTGNANTAPPAGTAWPVTLPVYSTTQLSQHRKTGFMSLARLMGFFWPAEAYACYTMPPPETYIRTFVNADITGVTYSSSGNEGNYSYPKTVNGVRYTNKKDFLERYPDSVWNVNTLTIKNVTDASTVSPPGSTSGGPPNNQVNQGAPANVGPIATIPRLVQ